MITIFTPTYNRISLLKRCYESLKRQSCLDFEWLVIDDGSEDGTQKLVERIQNLAPFRIIYIRQERGGKHRAFNRAVCECKQKYLLLLDSDDILTRDAIRVLNDTCRSIDDNSKICGVIGNIGRIDSREIIGSKLPNVESASGLELYQKMGFEGDTMRLYKTEVLKKYLFPTVKGENFIPENVVYDKIDHRYKMMVLHKIVYLCEYQEDGLSKNIEKKRRENPIGYMLSLKSTAETALTIKKKIGVTALCIVWSRKFHIKHLFRNYRSKVLYIICYPLSWALQIARVPRSFFKMTEGIQ